MKQNSINKIYVDSMSQNIIYLADQGPFAHLPSEIATLSSSYEVTSTILLPKEKIVNMYLPDFSNTVS